LIHWKDDPIRALAADPFGILQPVCGLQVVLASQQGDEADAEG
jgi:hypothetical protein